jgi:hypothetical protein
MEAELAGHVQFPQSGHKLSPKHQAENAHRQEEPDPRRNPPRMVRIGLGPFVGVLLLLSLHLLLGWRRGRWRLR